MVVALLAVGRAGSLSARRAWIEMMSRRNKILPLKRSLSARRAWIEMRQVKYVTFSTASLSARRAWIEISRIDKRNEAQRVALRKESVDRNVLGYLVARQNTRRSPQGERG